ncbi:MAG: glycosyltransferase family 4 protein [Flavobacteriales bacterium]|nr:glycosyltransferase family 4 protein [Flavobacteriales bacterium]
MRKRILFLTDNFPPEVNAPATRTYEHCCQWVKQGYEVTVITCFPNFPKGKVFEGYKNSLYKKEEINGIKVIRVWSYITANKGFVKRTLDFISFSTSSFIAGLFQNCDVIIATSPQFFTALSGRTLSFFKNKPWIMEVRDLWPESIKTVGAMNDNIIIRYFEKEEKWCYNSASHIVVVTDSFQKKLIEKGISAEKISVVKNGANMELYQRQPKNMKLKNDLGLEGKNIIGYIGTHGMAHKLDFILKCASHQNNNNIHYLFIGDGAEKENLLKIKDELHLTNVTMLPSVPKEQVKEYLSIMDIALINLKKSDLFTTVIPSKIFESAAMGIPMLMGVEGEAKGIIEKYHAGVCFEPENEEDFLNKQKQLLDDTAFYAECQIGCEKLALDFDRKKLAAKMLEIITTLVPTKG